MIASAEARDDLTAVVKLKQLYVPFVAETLVGWPPLPEHVQGKMTTEAFGRRPVGNGPFKFVEWVSGDHITLERNPLYWRDPKPWLDRLICKFLPDRNTVIAQAKTGGIDIGVDYTEAQIPELSNIPNVDLLISRQNVIERYHFTMVTAEDVKKLHHLWGDVRLRRAVTHATDRQTIVDTVLHGKTRVAKTQLDNTPYENTKIKPLPFDPAQARRILDEAGWKPGPDGIRVKDGIRFSFTHTTTAGNQTRETIQALVQANLKDIGVEMKIMNFPGGTFFASFLEGGPYISRKYDMVGVAGGLASLDPSIRVQYHSRRDPDQGEAERAQPRRRLRSRARRAARRAAPDPRRREAEGAALEGAAAPPRHLRHPPDVRPARREHREQAGTRSEGDRLRERDEHRLEHPRVVGGLTRERPDHRRRPALATRAGRRSRSRRLRGRRGQPGEAGHRGGARAIHARGAGRGAARPDRGQHGGRLGHRPDGRIVGARPKRGQLAPRHHGPRRDRGPPGLSADAGFFNPSLRRDYLPLAGHVLYTTIEPCGMCAWAIGMTGVSTVVIGARLADFGVRYGDYTFERVMALMGREPTVLSSLVDESVRLVLAQQREIAGGPTPPAR